MHRTRTIAPISAFLESAYCLFAVLVCCAMSASTAHAEYHLVWAEEFDGDRINQANWNLEVNGDGGGNNELQFYTDRPENAYLEDGCLVIQARKETYRGHAYTSARLNTKGKHDFRYGKIEARIKLPSGQGLWPAFWMMPADSAYGTWAASGEIDIMEATNAHPDVIHGTIHYGGTWPNNMYQGGSYKGPAEADTPVDFSQAFHVYTLEWQPHEMRWYVDGNRYSTLQKWHTTSAPYPAPFDKEFYLILNLAIGGHLPGPPDSTTPWPQRMLVDWVRVYQTTNQPPELEVVRPVEGQQFPEGSEIEIIAQASDPDDNLARVSVFAGKEKVGSAEQAPFRITWTPPDGHYRLVVNAEDADGFATTRVVNIVQGKGTIQTPYRGEPAAVPGRIEAEDFDNGIAGDAYWDFDEANQGGAYRDNVQVDIQPCDEGGYNLGWVVDGEWLEYTLRVARSQAYRVVLRAAAPEDGGSAIFSIDGAPIGQALSVPRTGDWQQWRDVASAPVDLEAGVHTLRLHVPTGGFNINYIEILPADER